MKTYFNNLLIPSSIMGENLVIEPIKHSNFNEFLYLVDKLAEYEKLTPPDNKAKIRLRKDGVSANPKYEAFLAKFNGKYVGYLIFFMSYSSFLALPTLYLEDIFILKDFRKKGIGQELFKFCVSKAKEKGCGRIEWHVLEWNKLGIDFYEKNKGKHLTEWYYYRLTNDRFDDFLS
jgi:GNAT superfamily N-acetyltransferase